MFDHRTHENYGLFYLRWVARILSIATISLLFTFYLGEDFDAGKVVLKEWVGLLFFPFGVVLGFIISWKKEGLGGLISTISLSAFYLIYGLILNGKFWQGGVFMIFALPGFLFVAYGLLLPKRISNFK